MISVYGKTPRKRPKLDLVSPPDTVPVTIEESSSDEEFIQTMMTKLMKPGSLIMMMMMIERTNFYLYVYDKLKWERFIKIVEHAKINVVFFCLFTFT